MKKIRNKNMRWAYFAMNLLFIVFVIICATAYAIKSQDVPVKHPEQATLQKIEPLPKITMDPQQNQKIGLLKFPKADMDVPIVYGYNPSYMDQFPDEVGLEAWGNFPGENNKLYISGHRNLSFQNLKHAVVGDMFIIEMDYGIFTYKVTDTKIYEATDDEAIDFYNDDRDTAFTPQILRLQTCYPFESGATLDHRFMVDLVLVDSQYK